MNLAVACAVLGGLALADVATASIYRSASADSAGRVEIVTAAGRTVSIPPGKEQAGVDAIAVAPSGKAVGWLALYPNPATSYPIPLELIVYADGTLRRFRGNELPVWRWHFLDHGAEVAFEQETVHGGMGVHYERRRVRDGRLMAQFTPEVDNDGRLLTDDGPAWTRHLDQDR
jgi:hypothetical protein